ncbi:MAG: hypothetical protein JSR59_14365 [Proteobacteria bacterium]|nr:hypothetical protein [Pseudomonadota bacterium]
MRSLIELLDMHWHAHIPPGRLVLWNALQSEAERLHGLAEGLLDLASAEYAPARLVRATSGGESGHSQRAALLRSSRRGMPGLHCQRAGPNRYSATPGCTAADRDGLGSMDEQGVRCARPDWTGARPPAQAAHGLSRCVATKVHRSVAAAPSSTRRISRP